MRARPGAGLDVEQHGEVGQQAARGPQVDLADHVRAEGATDALVGDRRVDVAVGDDDGATGERRADEPRDVLGARRGVQQRLGAGVEAGVLRGEHHLADRLGGGGAARLAGEHDLAAGGRERLGQRARLRGLARALAALEGDEQPGGGRRRGAHGPNPTTPGPHAPRRTPTRARCAGCGPSTSPGAAP